MWGSCQLVVCDTTQHILLFSVCENTELLMKICIFSVLPLFFLTSIRTVTKNRCMETISNQGIITRYDNRKHD